MTGTGRDAGPKVLVTGDLCLDNVIFDLQLGGVNRIPSGQPAAGGSAFNAALAFKREGFDPIVFGAVGDDPAGDIILNELERNGIGQLITRDQDRPTAQCNILHFRGPDGLRTIYYEADNANTYDVELLRDAIGRAGLGSGDFLFSSLYIIEQMDRQIPSCRPFLDELSAAPGQLIVDLVPHRLYDFCDADAIRSLLTGDTWLMIGEFLTFFHLIHRMSEPAPAAPTRQDCELIARTFGARHFSCRYGVAGIGYEILFSHDVHRQPGEPVPQDTGYARLRPDQIRGFGDLLTARAVRALSGPAPSAPPVEEMEIPA
jgi:hypothetical protein